MLYLVLLIFSVFLVFFIGDFILTIKTINRAGIKVELNPLMRLRRQFLYVFKATEIIVFFSLIYYLTILKSTLPFYSLLTFIFLYGLLVANNAHVYYRITAKESGVFHVIFILMLLLVLLFIYLNYILYSDIKVVYGALSASNEDYGRLYERCSEKISNVNASLPKDIKTVLESLNLTIKKSMTFNS